MKQKKFTKCSVCSVSVNRDNLVEHLRHAHNKTIDNGVIRERASANPPKVDTANGQILNITACDVALAKGARLMNTNRQIILHTGIISELRTSIKVTSRNHANPFHIVRNLCMANTSSHHPLF